MQPYIYSCIESESVIKIFPTPSKPSLPETLHFGHPTYAHAPTITFRDLQAAFNAIGYHIVETP